VIILAIDPGTSCGIALGSADRPLIHSATWTLKPGRGESPGVRYLQLVDRLNRIRADHPGLALIVIEQAHNRGGAATHYAHGYQAHVESWCASHGIEHTTVHSTRLKMHATGKGNAKKPQMIAAAATRWPEVCRRASEDEIEALWLLDYYRREVMGWPEIAGDVVEVS
jgi:Holliday junction resolvasome RuvABC endonuclease subunit